MAHGLQNGIRNAFTAWNHGSDGARIFLVNVSGLQPFQYMAAKLLPILVALWAK